MSKLHMQSIMRPKAGSTQVKAYTGTAAAIDNVISNGITAIHVKCTTDAHIRIGTSPTATTSDFPVSAGIDYWFPAREGEKVSAIQQSSGGNLFVTEMTQ